MKLHTQRERQPAISPTKMLAWTGFCWAEAPGARIFYQVLYMDAFAQALGPFSAGFPCTLTGNLVRSKSAETGTGSCLGCQHHRRWPYLLIHSVVLHLFYLKGWETDKKTEFFTIWLTPQISTTKPRSPEFGRSRIQTQALQCRMYLSYCTKNLPLIQFYHCFMLSAEL